MQACEEASGTGRCCPSQLGDLQQRKQQQDLDERIEKPAQERGQLCPPAESNRRNGPGFPPGPDA